MVETAVLMIDLQNTYIADDGVRDALGWPPIWRLEAVVRECAELAEQARRQQFPLIYSRMIAGQSGLIGTGPRPRRHLQHRRPLVPKVSAEQREWKSRILDDVAPRRGDIVLTKTRHSFFAYTELEPLLRNLGAHRLVVAGLQTNVCVEATVRAALERNFDVAVPDDAVSTDGPALHYASLDAMRVLYVEVAPWRELLAPDAPWDRAYTTPDYGRDPEYWRSPTT
ncbi:cysteine hydrolase family protein [Nocardia brasiliensis]|uniref:cysteine hydrolase family protein n=1 Tax=Nocardia brasiliensis TaxID=37326 RepID=UPI0037BB3762